VEQWRRFLAQRLHSAADQSNVVGPNKQFTPTLFNATLNGTNTPSLLGFDHQCRLCHPQ
jgi:hypothetical protein